MFKTSAIHMLAMALSKRTRQALGFKNDPFPAPPSDVHLSPSELHFADYDSAPLRLAHVNFTGSPQQWQDAARAKLAAIAGYQLMPDAPTTRYRVEHIHVGALVRRSFYLHVKEGSDIPLHIICPIKADLQPSPVMICLQGTNSGAHLSWGEARFPADIPKISAGHDFGLQAARHGFIAVCMELSCFGERQERLLKPKSAAPCVDASNHALLLGRCLLGERTSDVSSVVSWIFANAGDFNANVDEIFILGHSSGGSVAIFSTALDRRIAGVIASGCIGFIRETIGRRRDDQGQNVVPGILQWLEEDDILALCAPRPALIVSGVTDHIWPFEGASRVTESARHIYEALGAADHLVAVSGSEGHRFYPEITWSAFDRLRLTQGPI